MITNQPTKLPTLASYIQSVLEKVAALLGVNSPAQK
jgi:hypothetical protein